MLTLVSRWRGKASGAEIDLGLFRERERARQDLQRIAQRAPESLLTALLPLVEGSPDPDQAVNLFERLTGECDEALLLLLEQNPTLLHYAVVVFGHSYWLGETLLHNPDLFGILRLEKNFERSHDRDDYRANLAWVRGQASELDISTLLARFKKREYIRIFLRDALGIATVAETTEEISALADVMIEEGLRQAEVQMRLRYGSPQFSDTPGQTVDAPFAVLSLGKLGGNELNYSSDVDLLCIYGDQELSGSLSRREFFIRQAQLLTEILSRATPEGTPFRVDLRLRPEGNEGEPAVELKRALSYYAHAAHDWELQALIKARYTAGDTALAREFIRGVQPRVYTENVNFAAIETARHSRHRMGVRRRQIAGGREPGTINVKVDGGGIRDIEFLVQCLQRVYGGEERWLRSGGTLFSLQKLHDKGHLSGKDFHELTQAYQFLRKVEHRLQLQRGQQLHELPSTAVALEILHRAVDRDAAESSASAFLRDIQARMNRVREVYESIIHSERLKRSGGPAASASSEWSGRNLSFDQVLERAAVDMPLLAGPALHGLGLHARRNLHRFLSSAMTSSERYAPLLEAPQRVIQALPLFATSDYLTDILIRHPDAIRVLDEHQERHLGDVSHDPITGSPDHQITRSTEPLAALRRDFRRFALAVGAQDVLSPRSAIASLREITRIGDAAIRRALAITEGDRHLALFALGRLGTDEFDIASDADLLFVRAPEAPEADARLDAEKLVHAVSAYTREGAIFAVDARLRPHGGAGELVVTPAMVEKYLAEEAQPWEALTYTKLRFIAGREDLAPRVLTGVWRQIVEMAFKPDFPQAVVEMRTRLEKSNRYANSFKLARGGFYDIDFIAAFLMLKHASLTGGNTLDRLEHLHRNGILPTPTFATLHRATLLYRTADHVIRLITGRARPELPEAEHARQATEALLNKILNRDSSRDLQAEFRETEDEVRKIFTELVSG
jgi:glutamate-ammonia-ligase adenylyltransferase